MSTYDIFCQTWVESSFWSLSTYEIAFGWSYFVQFFFLQLMSVETIVSSRRLQLFFFVDSNQEYFLVDAIFQSMLTRVLLANVGWWCFLETSTRVLWPTLVWDICLLMLSRIFFVDVASGYFSSQYWLKFFQLIETNFCPTS